tara:strand:+ start:408 stop:605 length:198 start_codon:yes stop_codon:yes gene_type:complete
MQIHSYLDQLQSAADKLGVRLPSVAYRAGMQSHLSRWMRNKSTPRLAQAQRLLKAIRDEASQIKN